MGTGRVWAHKSHQIHELDTSISSVESYYDRAGCVVWTDAPECMFEGGAWGRGGCRIVRTFFCLFYCHSKSVLSNLTGKF